MPSLEQRVDALEAKVFGAKPAPKVTAPEHFPDISVAEAKKLGDVKWRKLGTDKYSAVDRKTGKRYSITAEEYAELTGKG